MVENRNRKQFSTPFCGKNEFLGFSWDCQCPLLGAWEVDIRAHKLLYGVEHLEKISRFQLERYISFSTSKQGIPKFSAVSNTRARVLQKWQDSLTYVVCFRYGRAINLRNPPTWRKITRLSFFPDFRGSLYPKVQQYRGYLCITQFKTLIQLKKFDVSSPLCSRDMGLGIQYCGQCCKNQPKRPDIWPLLGHRSPKITVVDICPPYLLYVREDCFRGRGQVSGDKRQITRGVSACACAEIS